MDETIIRLDGAERAELADLADAVGSTPEAVALEAVRARLRAERARVGAPAGRLAARHSALLKRLGS